jgi:hypothetical protein
MSPRGGRRFGEDVCMFVRLCLAQQPNAGQGRLVLEVSKSHSFAPHSVGLLWTTDRPVAETSI